MKIKTFQITSPSTLDLTLTVDRPICILRGYYAALALDLMRELLGDFGAQNDPDRFDDGHFVIHADVEIDQRNFAVCYIRNADFMGDNRIAANFVSNSLAFSQDDTVEFVDKCNACAKDDLPLFLYKMDSPDQTAVQELLGTLASCGKQVFIAVCSNYPAPAHQSVQYADVDPA